MGSSAGGTETAISLEIVGLGIILYSPSSASHIAVGQDYFESSYSTESDVQSHVQAGTIVGFGTGSPGRFLLRMHQQSPPPAIVTASEFVLRLGILVLDDAICLRDLYDLMHWSPRCPDGQRYAIPNGTYRVTLTSNMPESGVLGDDQVIDVFFERWDRMPELSPSGIPTLCD
jgi:hypothetical protein